MGIILWIVGILVLIVAFVGWCCLKIASISEPMHDPFDSSTWDSD